MENNSEAIDIQYLKGRVDALEKAVEELKKSKADTKDIDIVKIGIDNIKDKLEEFIDSHNKKENEKKQGGFNWGMLVVGIGQAVTGIGMFILAFK